MANGDVAIKVEGVHKEFRLPHDKQNSLKGGLISVFKNGKRSYETQKVLKGVSFEIKHGEFFGIVGRNGSGKSTLLKMLAGIYTPTKGHIEINGSLTPFIELGVGFNPELTGRENVFLNGALLGFNREEMAAMYDDIVEFAELERFMDQKLKNYSSGMQVRLAFSIAIRVDTDILVLDEVLAVGDEAFQRKCENYFNSVKGTGKTVVLVTHSMEAVRKFCSKAMMIHDGEIVAIGSPEDVANEYSIENLNVPNANSKASKDEQSIIKDLKVEMLNPSQIDQDGQVEIKVSYKTTKETGTYPVCDLKDMDRNTPLVTAGSALTTKKSVTRTWKVKLPAINNTNVIANITIRDENNDTLYFLPNDQSPKFLLRRNDYPNPKKPTTYALLFDKGKWDD